jgi:hypothetical protein
MDDVYNVFSECNAMNPDDDCDLEVKNLLI